MDDGQDPKNLTEKILALSPHKILDQREKVLVQREKVLEKKIQKDRNTAAAMRASGFISFIGFINSATIKNKTAKNLLSFVPGPSFYFVLHDSWLLHKLSLDYKRPVLKNEWISAFGSLVTPFSLRFLGSRLIGTVKFGIKDYLDNLRGKNPKKPSDKYNATINVANLVSGTIGEKL